MTCKDCKVISREFDHTTEAIVLDICIRSRKRWVVNKMCSKTRWRDLKGERGTIFKDKVIADGEWNFKGETTTVLESNG